MNGVINGVLQLILINVDCYIITMVIYIFHINFGFIDLINSECEKIVDVYKIYAWPYLDYASVVYSPHCLYLIDTVESIQSHFAKSLHNLCNLS